MRLLLSESASAICHLVILEARCLGFLLCNMRLIITFLLETCEAQSGLVWVTGHVCRSIAQWTRVGGGPWPGGLQLQTGCQAPSQTDRPLSS